MAAPSSVTVGTVQWISLAFSFVALITSAIVAYTSTLSGSDIQVSVSSPQWVMRDKTIQVKLTCVFSNRGARTGVVEDVMLRLESEDDTTRWLFYPGLRVDDTKFLEADAKGIMGTVYPVSIAGKQTQAVTYLFLPMLKHPNFPYGEINPHKFRFVVMTRSNGCRRWKKQPPVTVVLSQDTLNAIQTGTTMQQYPEEFDQARRNIK
jgi:hypothetical protein